MHAGSSLFTGGGIRTYVHTRRVLIIPKLYRLCVHMNTHQQHGQMYEVEWFFFQTTESVCETERQPNREMEDVFGSDKEIEIMEKHLPKYSSFLERAC